MSNKIGYHVWSYTLESREEPTDRLYGDIVMPTKCGVTVADQLSQDYETHYVIELRCSSFPVDVSHVK